MALPVQEHESDDPQVALVQTLFLKHSADIQGYLFALAPDTSLVDDLLHEVFLCVTAKADQFREGTNFRAWSRAIAKIEVVRLRRERQRSPRSLVPEVIDKLADCAPSFDIDNERIEAVKQCVDELAPRPKESLKLRYVHSLKPPQIAQQMSLTINSVNVMLSRARAAVRHCVRKKLGLEGNS